MTRRDPEGRRRAIIEAAKRLIAEVGVAGLTHRRVAAAAGVPLGATTYYFKDLGDLIQAALAHCADASAAGVDDWRRVLDASSDIPATLTELTAEYLADQARYRTVNELYTAAAHRPELRPLARVWSDGLISVLTPHTGRQAAQAAVVFLDGVLLHALINDQPLDNATLTAALTALLSHDRQAPS